MAEKVLHLVISDDDFIAANKAREMYEEASRDVVDDMSLEIIDSTVNKIDDAISVCKRIIDAALTVPLFGGKKVVWARNVNFLNDSPIAKNDQVKETLEYMAKTFAELSPNDAIVIMNASPVNRLNKSLKALSAIAEFEDFKTKNVDNVCADLLKSEAKKIGVSLEHNVAETIASIVANNTRMALQELKKLSAYVNFERPITEKDVMEMVPIFGEGDFFEITNAFYSGKMNVAMAVLRRYFFTNKSASARPIITAIQRQNSILIQLRSLMDSNILPKVSFKLPYGSIANAGNVYGKYFEGCDEKTCYNIFSQNTAYVESRLASIASRFPLKKLLDIQMNLIKAFNALIERPNNDEAIMRELFLTIH